MTNVFVACPAHWGSGGVELLHQLCAELDRIVDINAEIWYVDGDARGHLPQYQCYENKWTNDTPKSDCIVIFPEIWANEVNNPKFENRKVCIYWESVDNYFVTTPESAQYKFREDTIHLAQSYYAYDFLKNKCHIPESQIFFVTDYLNDDYLTITADTKKKKQVAYNPAKGKVFTEKLMNAMPDVNFVPIQNMTREQVKQLLLDSMVYIDFGHHPGKDRIPREACMCGCHIITSTNGSAKFYEDVPILYKYESTDGTIPVICNAIRAMLDDYDRYTADFVGYREQILREKPLFKTQVSALAWHFSKLIVHPPRFSIIIPAYNASGHIKKALESIKSQDFKDYELIVVCDSCTDDTEEIALNYGASTVCVNFHNDGLTRSKGLDFAKGEYVLFMDDDDWWLHEYVLTQIDDKLKKENNPDVLAFSFIFKGWKYADPHGNGGSRWIACWNKAWKRSCIGNTRFPNIKMSSDVNFHHDMMKKNLRIVDWDMPMYYYNYMRVGSQTEIDNHEVS